MSDSPSAAEAADTLAFRQAAGRSMHAHWTLYLAEGIVLILLGFAALIVPPLASLTVAIFVGWLFLIGGIFGLITTTVGREAPGYWWSLVSAALAIVAGGLLLFRPVSGVVSLTALLTAYFALDGIASIMMAIEHRRDAARAWAWLIASGVLDLVLAAIIISGFPETATWAIGLIVGIDLIFGGSALAALALRARADGT